MFQGIKIPTKENIINAFGRIRPYINETPVLTSQTINKITGSELFFKCENFQKGGAFKYRGATNAVLKLDKQLAANGVCTHSSGNHAQALALAARINGLSAYIVMPENAPQVKVNAVKEYGAQITFCKPTLQAREETLAEIKQKTGAAVIHPYNNPDVIEGQATCLFEMNQQINFHPDIVICPVGGGGLLSGTLLTAKYFLTDSKVIAAEPEMANDAWKSLKANRFIPSDNPQTIADGLKTSLGTLTWPLIQQNVTDIFTTSEQSIIETMYLVWERMKIIIEPSSAVALAVVINNRPFFTGKRVAVIFSGGNVDLKHLPWN